MLERRGRIFNVHPYSKYESPKDVEVENSTAASEDSEGDVHVVLLNDNCKHGMIGQRLGC